jgi:hypothetical protein
METTSSPEYIIQAMEQHIDRSMKRIESARRDIAGYQEDIELARMTIYDLMKPPSTSPAPRGTKYTAAFEAARRIIGETDEPVTVEYLAQRIMDETGCKTTYAHDAIRNISYAGHAVLLGSGRGATIMKTNKENKG